jgi:hypothetical protein
VITSRRIGGWNDDLGATIMGRNIIDEMHIAIAPMLAGGRAPAHRAPVELSRADAEPGLLMSSDA